MRNRNVGSKCNCCSLEGRICLVMSFATSALVFLALQNSPISLTELNEVVLGTPAPMPYEACGIDPRAHINPVQELSCYAAQKDYVVEHLPGWCTAARMAPQVALGVLPPERCSIKQTIFHSIVSETEGHAQWLIPSFLATQVIVWATTMPRFY